MDRQQDRQTERMKKRQRDHYVLAYLCKHHKKCLEVTQYMWTMQSLSVHYKWVVHGCFSKFKIILIFLFHMKQKLSLVPTFPLSIRPGQAHIRQITAPTFTLHAVFPRCVCMLLRLKELYSVLVVILHFYNIDLQGKRKRCPRWKKRKTEIN